MPIEDENIHGTSPALPAYVQDEHLVCYDEVIVTTPSGAWTGDFTSLFDRRSDTSLSSVAGGSILITFKAPLLIGRIAISGNIPNGGTITVTKVDGAVEVYTPPQNTSGYDTDNFTPYMALSVLISMGANVSINEISILKTIVGVGGGGGGGGGTSQVVISELNEFAGQKVYYDPLQIGEGEEYNYYILTRIPFETNTDDNPSVNLDSTVAVMVSDTSEELRIDVYFHELHGGINTIRDRAGVMITVEASANARCINASCRLYRKRISDGVMLPITDEKVVPLNFDGPAIRHVRFILQYLTSAEIQSGELLVLQVSLWGGQIISSPTPSYLTLWHRRGTFDCKLEIDMTKR